MCPHVEVVGTEDGTGQTEPMDGLERSRKGAREHDQRHRQPDQ